jgi:hypothetical protein
MVKPRALPRIIKNKYLAGYPSCAITERFGNGRSVASAIIDATSNEESPSKNLGLSILMSDMTSTSVAIESSLGSF